MPFKHACFISYRHHQQSALAERFVTELYEALRNEVTVQLEEEIFLDRERFTGGVLFNPALQYALCRSVCMIVVYTPTYFSRAHLYCAQEYLAMTTIETQRLARMAEPERSASGLIIPIVLRGESTLPQEIRDKRHYYNFDKFSMTSGELSRDSRFDPAIQEIAREVFRRKRAFESLGIDPDTNCADIPFPSTEQTIAWLETVIAPPIPFPFRGAA